MTYTFSKLIFPVLQKLFVKKIIGVENIPKKGPFLLISNHQSHLDGFLLGTIVFKKRNQKIHFLAKQEFTSYFGSWIEHLIYEKWAGCIFVEKEGTVGKGQEAIQEAAAVLQKGELVGIFPEGKRTYDGSLLEGRTGAARIVFAAQEHRKTHKRTHKKSEEKMHKLFQIPLIPFGIRGANSMLPRKAIIPRIWKSRICIAIGKPFYILTVPKQKRTKALLRKQTTMLMKKIATCAGEPYAP